MRRRFYRTVVMEYSSKFKTAIDYQTRVRKRRAAFLVGQLSGKEKKIVATIAEFPHLTDKQIGKKLFVGADTIGEVRTKYQIPSVFYAGMNDEPELYKRRCEEDDKKLDAGVCEVNLFGDERERYLIFYEEKRQGKRR